LPLKLGKDLLEMLSSSPQEAVMRKFTCILLILILFSSYPLVPSFLHRQQESEVDPNLGGGLLIPGAKALHSGDIVIGEGELVVLQDQVIAPPGDIIVEEGGTLVLRGTEIVFNHTGYYEHGILLKNGSTLELYDSQIIGLGNLFFFRAHGATITVDNSTFWRTHAICGNTTRITIRGSHLWALHCLNDTRVDAADADLSYLLLMGDSSARVARSQMIEIILYDRSHASVSDTNLRFIFYFDEGTATISNCTYEDEIRFGPNLCDLTILVQDEETAEPVPTVGVYLNRSWGDAVASSRTGDEGTVSFRGVEEGDYMVQLVGDGYEPLSVRISVLDEAQLETFLITGMSAEVEEPLGPENPPPRALVPLLIAAALIFLSLGVVFRRGVKGFVEGLR